MEAEHLTEGPALAGEERGSVPELAAFVVLVLVCASIAVASFQASQHRQVSATQQLLAADAVKATLAAIEEELNSALHGAIVAAMYDVGLAGGSREQVERQARLYLNQRISLGWRRGNMVIEVPPVDEGNLTFEWRPDGGVVAKGYLAAEVRHIMGPAAHGVALEASPLPRFERLRNVALQLLPRAGSAADLAAMEEELNSLYSPEGLVVSLQREEDEVIVAVGDVLAAASAYVGSGRQVVRYVTSSASLGGEGGAGDNGAGGGGGGENQAGGGGGGGGGQPSQPSAWLRGRVVEKYTGLPVWDVLISPSMTNSGSGGWLLYFPASGMTNNNGDWSIRVVANSYGTSPTSWSAKFTFSKSGWLGASLSYSGTASYVCPDLVLSPSDVGTIQMERQDYGSFSLSINPWSGTIYVYWDSREGVWKTDKSATTTATVGGDYCAPIDISVYPADLLVSVSPTVVAIADPRSGGSGFASASISASAYGLGPNYYREVDIWAKGRTGFNPGKKVWALDTKISY